MAALGNERFVEAATLVNKTRLLANVSPGDQLRIRGLYKHACKGDCSDTRPDDTPQQEYDAWKHWRGMSKFDAQNQFIDTIDRLSKQQTASVEAAEWPYVEGLLKKRRDHLSINAWRERYFRLRGKLLEYYLHQTDSKLRGSMYIAKVSSPRPLHSMR